MRTASREGTAADHGARTVIAVSFARVDVATDSWIARNGTGDVMELYDQALALPRTGP